MAEAQKASGTATKKQTAEQALRLMVRLRRQSGVREAFGKYRWRGNLEWDANGQHYETLAICQQLAYARRLQGSRSREARRPVHDPQPYPRGEAASRRGLVGGSTTTRMDGLWGAMM